MKHSEVIALRKAFNSVKERQALNPPADFAEKKKRLASARELCIGNEELLLKSIDKLQKNGIKVHLAKDKNEAVEIILNEIGDEKLIVKSKSKCLKRDRDNESS